MTADRSTMDQALRHWDRLSPDAPAALAPGLPPLDYAGLWRVCRQVAAALGEAGAAPGSRIALFIPQSRDAEVLDTAISTFAVPVPLDPDHSPAALRAFGERLRPALAIATPRTAAAAAALGCPVLVLDPALLVPGEAPASDPAPRRPGDHAIILATSGSTGEPRLIPRTHAQLAISTRAWIDRLGVTRDNTGFIFAPPFHAMGAMLFRSLFAGSAAVVLAEAAPAAILSALRAAPPTWLLAGPSRVAAILARDD
ncbi:MAG: AMP-binding protein, partial [Chloroflexota bacterium]